jgi:hypothetical protein
MFERYTEKSRRVIFFARYEASQVGAAMIGTEHLLLAIFREEKDLMCRIFSASALNEIAASLQALPKGEPDSTGSDKALSEESKKVLSNAAQEADALQDRHIKPGHLLMGIFDERDCLAARILSKHATNVEEIRRLIHSKLEGVPADISDYPFDATGRNGWSKYGIPSHYAYPELVYNSVAQTLIVEVSSVGKQWAPTRLFYRHKDSSTYTQLGTPADDTSYESVVSAANRQIIAFNSLKWTVRSDEEGQKRVGGDWAAVHIYDLKSHQITHTITSENLHAGEQGSLLWVCGLDHLAAGADILYVRAGQQHGSKEGHSGRAEYFLAELDLHDLTLKKICPLPGTFL